MPYNDLEDEDELELEEPMPGGMPNVPRNPDKEDPRQKIKDYLARQEARSSLREDPEYRQLERAPMDELRGSNRDINLMNLFQQSANQMGTIGGKSASNAPMQEFSKNLMAQNAATRGDIMGQRQAAQGDEDRQLKIKQYLADKMTSDEQKTGDLAFKRDKLAQQKDYQDKLLGLKGRMAAAAEGKPDKMGPGQTKLDTLAAQDYNDWNSTGKPGVVKNLASLERAKKDLEAAKGDFLTSGNVVGRVPDFARSQKSIEIQENVRESAISALRAALGSQFTEKENAAIQNLSYNPTLSPEANMKKIDRAIAYITAVAQNAEAKANFFQNNNMSLVGFKDQAPSIDQYMEDEREKYAKEDEKAGVAAGAVGTQKAPPAQDLNALPEDEIDRLYREAGGT